MPVASNQGDQQAFSKKRLHKSNYAERSRAVIWDGNHPHVGATGLTACYSIKGFEIFQASGPLFEDFLPRSPAIFSGRPVIQLLGNNDSKKFSPMHYLNGE
ncbi:MAG: hypothetical protein ACE5OZ_19895 [Candidatus Heimdallarchaeota archaeon]